MYESSIIKMHLKSLGDFQGREARAQFWPYVGIVVGVTMVASTVATLAIILPTFSSPSAAVPSFSYFLYAMIGATVLAVALLGAAVSRRLHDRGLSGAWGFIPLPFLCFSLMGMTWLSGSFEDQPSDTIFMAVFASNAVYNIALIILIVLLAAPSEEGENRFGENPKQDR